MQLSEPGQQLAWASLQRRWFIFTGLCLLFLTGGFSALSASWGAKYAAIWLILPSLNIVYLLFVLQHNLAANHRAGESELLKSLGWGNHLTLLRGVLVAGMLGFMFQPQPPGWLAWIPGLLYIISDIADFSDGLAARLTNHVTRLGEILDMSFDGLGVMAAALLAVQYGQAPAWYVAIAFARYLFLAGLWLRRKLGRPVYDLTPNISRRLFAGFQMGFLGIILLPLFSPPGTHIAATLFGLPLLVGFTLDWLAVSGVVRPGQHDRHAIQSLAMHWLPVVLRLLILVLAIISLAQYAQNPAIPGLLGLVVNLLYGLAVLLVTFGFFPRVSTVLGLCLLGVYQMYASLTSVQIISAIAYTLILYMGSGAYSAWAPEDYLIYHRAGEREMERQR